MYSVLIVGIVLWLLIGFIAAYSLYALSDRELTVGEMLTASAGLSTAGPLLLVFLIAHAVSALSESPAVWGEE